MLYNKIDYNVCSVKGIGTANRAFLCFVLFGCLKFLKGDMALEVQKVLIYILVFLAACVIIAMAVKIAVSFRGFKRDAKRLKSEIGNASSDSERAFWRNKLKWHYLSLIPFVTPERTESINRMFYTGKHLKEEKKNSITAMLAPSIAGICLCAVCMCGLSWAWFSAGVTSSSNTITAATYDIKVDVAGDSGTVSAGTDGSYALTAGEYTVTLTSVGTARSGYCVVEQLDVSERVLHHTPNIAGDASVFTFKISASGDVRISFTAQWGSYSGESDIAEGSIIPFASASAGLPEANQLPNVNGSSDTQTFVNSSSAAAGTQDTVSEQNTGGHASSEPAVTVSEKPHLVTSDSLVSDGAVSDTTAVESGMSDYSSVLED